MAIRFNEYLSTELKKYFIFITISTSIIFIILTIFVFQKYLNFKLEKDNREIMEKLEKDIFNISKTFADADILLAKDDFETTDQLSDLFYQLRKNSEIKFNFTVLDLNNQIIATNLYKNNRKILLDTLVINSRIRDVDVLDIKKIVVDAAPRYNDLQKSVMTILFKGENSYLIIEPLYESFVEIEDNLSSDIIVTDQFDNVLYNNTERYQGNIGKVSIDPEEYLFVKTDFGIFKIINVRKKLLKLVLLQYYTAGVIVTIFFLVWFLNPFIKRKVKKLDAPLKELLRAIKSNRNGNFDYFIRDDYNFIEFDKIYDEFNELMRSLKILMKKNNELLEIKKNIEIKHLKNQFNPHFIYNTLESIRYEVIFNQENASDMILALGKLMQYSIENHDTLVSIKHDLKHLENYLKLQKMRFKERLEYCILLENNLKKIKIPKLLIQPIVENSIKHNMEKTYRLKIKIRVYSLDNKIIFEISDNGIGIDEIELNDIRKTLKDKTKKLNKNLGLYNIHRVIKLMFGEDYGLTLVNKNSGLLVKVELPLRKGNLYD